MTRLPRPSAALARLEPRTAAQYGQPGMDVAAVLGYVDALEHRCALLEAEAARVQHARAHLLSLTAWAGEQLDRSDAAMAQIARDTAAMGEAAMGEAATVPAMEPVGGPR